MPRYVMREKMFAFGDDSWIEDESGERVYRVDGKALRMRKTLKLEDLDGNELLQDPGAQAARPRHDGDRGPGRHASRPDPEGDDHARCASASRSRCPTSRS